VKALIIVGLPAGFAAVALYQAAMSVVVEPRMRRRMDAHERIGGRP
jgi:hypothetical protein